jgi:hypothetical protein
MPAVQPCCQQVSAVQRCKVLPARTPWKDTWEDTKEVEQGVPVMLKAYLVGIRENGLLRRSLCRPVSAPTPQLPVIFYDNQCGIDAVSPACGQLMSDTLLPSNDRSMSDTLLPPYDRFLSDIFLPSNDRSMGDTLPPSYDRFMSDTVSATYNRFMSTQCFGLCRRGRTATQRVLACHRGTAACPRYRTTVLRALAQYYINASAPSSLVAGGHKSSSNGIISRSCSFPLSVPLA